MVIVCLRPIPMSPVAASRHGFKEEFLQESGGGSETAKRRNGEERGAPAPREAGKWKREKGGKGERGTRYGTILKGFCPKVPPRRGWSEATTPGKRTRRC